jgi:Tfp pilus assembly ATPase PilU
MQSFDRHLTALYRSGEISLEVAKSAASNPADFERALNFGDGAVPMDDEEDDDVLELDMADEA